MSISNKNVNLCSIDLRPWEHPFLTTENLIKFRSYSDQVHDFVNEYISKLTRPKYTYAFSVNMAQNMHKWAMISSRLGLPSTLFPHPLDSSQLSSPEWEYFDGEVQCISNDQIYLTKKKEIKLDIPIFETEMKGDEFLTSYNDFQKGNRRHFLKLVQNVPSLKIDALLKYRGFYPYFNWAKSLSNFDAIYTASSPIAAYFSGKPFCACSVGGDLQSDCGRPDDLGQLMTLSFNAAKFLMISNPHTLGHSRRLGFTNGIHVPYPMDTTRYKPGEGRSRNKWMSMFGGDFFVLSTARLDQKIKGQDSDFIKSLSDVSSLRQGVRFIFLNWGEGAKNFQNLIDKFELKKNIILLNPVGKEKLIDYYRSSDVIIDQLVYGYYGATALEAAAIGKPVLMKLREEQYRPLYHEDVAPVININNAEQLKNTLLKLYDDNDYRSSQGDKLLAWLKRNHGETTAGVKMTQLLIFTAMNASIPKDLENPLKSELTNEEINYHFNCMEPFG